MKPFTDYLFTLIFFILFLPPLSGQTYITDSIRNLLPTAEPGYDELDYRIGMLRSIFFENKFDELKEEIKIAKAKAIEYNDVGAQAYINIFEAYVALFLEADVDRSIQLGAEAMVLAEKAGDKDALTFATYQYAEGLSYEKGKYQEAIDLLEASIEQVDSTVTRKNIGNTYKNIAYAYSQLGNYEKSLDAYEKAVTIFQKIAVDPDINLRLGRVSALYMDGGIFNLGQTLVYLGGTYEKMGRLEEAEQSLLKSYSLFKNAQRDIGDHLAWSAGKLGVFYPKIGDYQKAIQYLQEARRTFETLGLERDQMETQVMLGDVFVTIEEKGEAVEAYKGPLRYYKSNKDSLRYLKVAVKQAKVLSELSPERGKKLLTESLRMANAVKDQALVAAINKEEAINLIREGDLDAARAKLNEVIASAESINDQALQVEALLELAETYQTGKDYAKASQIAQKSRAIAEVLNRRDLIGQINAFLAKSLEAQGDYQQALYHYKAYESYQDSISNEKTQSIIREEQVRQNVKTYQVEQEIAELRARALSSRNRQYLLLALALSLILLFGGYLFMQLRKT